jgi:tetratricopeptide (TPR) repeat protein
MSAAAQAVDRTRGQQPLYLVEALRVQGMVLARKGQPEEADRAFQEGLELARSLPYPYAEARILEQMGRGEEALMIFQRLGAAKDVERTSPSRPVGSRLGRPTPP